MKKSLKVITIIFSALILIYLICFVIFVYFFEPSNLSPYIIKPENLKGNMWILQRAPNSLDLSGIDKYIWSQGEKAIPELEKCVDKFTKKGNLEKANVCQGLIDWIRRIEQF